MGAEFERGLQDCPHCLSRVYLLDDGICPGCRRDVRDASPTRKVGLWVRESDVIPDRCHTCGSSARRKVQVSYNQSTGLPRTSSERDHDELVTTIFVLGLFGVIVAAVVAVVRQFFGWNGDRKLESVSIRIPECEKCRSGGVEPISADFQARSLRIAVHRDFAEAFGEMNYD